METWLIAVIAVSSILFVAICFFCMWRCCGKRNRKETFAWIERLGIPFARQGKPDEKDFPEHNKYRVHVQIKQETKVGNDNPSLHMRDEKYGQQDSQVVFYPTDENGDVIDNTEPFKRLDHLGIPRARRENSPDAGRRAPSSPLPSPVPDYQRGSSEDDEDQ